MRRFFLQQNDNRTAFIKQKLQEVGNNTFEIEKDISKMSKDDIVIVTPSYKWTIDTLQKIPQGATVFGGMFREELKEQINKLDYHNFMLDEDFVLKNATFTAEAFLVDLISNTKLSLFEQKILILGSGRVAKAIWLVLLKLGVNFDLAMRNKSEQNYARLISNKVFQIDDLKSVVGNYDTIINTIPFEIFENYKENNFKKDVTIFELASRKCLNKDNFPHINYIFCPSLPSKYLGDSAGKLMLQFILKTIN